jgi:hypothetical protein
MKGCLPGAVDRDTVSIALNIIEKRIIRLDG